ncbi:uncharacterized protein [Amphiura filiformis]|uniref:uncharacterized protein n=1 Tax=Amphiura filiformis TaxID=82378 RepID=UPI003B226F1F
MGETQADRTLWVGNLDSRVTEELLYELFLQAGPLAGVKKPSEKNYAFVEFQHDVSVPYSMSLMSGLRLFERALRLQFRSGSKHDGGSGTSSPVNPRSGTSSPGIPGPMGGMRPTGPMGMMTPPPLQRSLSVPGPPPHMMPHQFNQGMPGQPMGAGLLGPPPHQGMGMHPPHGNRFTPSSMSDERDSSSGHRSGRSYERHRSRDGDRRGSSDLRSYSPPLGQSPDFAGQRRGSFQGRESPSQRDGGGREFNRRHDDRGGHNQWEGEGRHGHQHGHGHHHSRSERSERGERSDRHRDDRSRSGDRGGQYRDNSRDRHSRNGRY